MTGTSVSVEMSSSPHKTERTPLLSSPNLQRRLSGEAVKTIGFFGSVVLLANNISGPAMLELPKVFDSAGVIPTSIAIIVTCVISSLSATLLADTLSCIPGNFNFDRNVEFSSSFKIFLNNTWFIVSEIIFFLSLMTQNIAAMVATSQALDSFLAQFVFGATWGLQLVPEVKSVYWVPGECEVEEGGVCIPFNDHGPLVLTSGYLVTAAILMPFGLQHLKENIVVQKISFVWLVFLCGEFFWAFYKKGMALDNLSWFGDDYSQLVGIVLFNFAFPITIPCWLHEKKSDVSVNSTVWIASVPSALLYLSFGMSGASCFPKVTDNILISLSSGHVDTLTRLCSSLFGVFIIGFGIPIFCVLMHQNLHSGGICSKRMSLFMGGVLPFLIGWTCYQGHVALTLLSWAGLFLTGFVAFIGPMIVCLVAAKNINAVDWNSVELRQEDPNNPDLHRYVALSTTRLERHSSIRGANGSVSPLPPWAEPYRYRIIQSMLVLFSFMVVFALYSNVVSMTQAPEIA